MCGEYSSFIFLIITANKKLQSTFPPLKGGPKIIEGVNPLNYSMKRHCVHTSVQSNSSDQLNRIKICGPISRN